MVIHSPSKPAKFALSFPQQFGVFFMEVYHPLALETSTIAPEAEETFP